MCPSKVLRRQPLTDSSQQLCEADALLRRLIGDNDIHNSIHWNPGDADSSDITTTFFPNACVPQSHPLLRLCSKSGQGFWPAASKVPVPLLRTPAATQRSCRLPHRGAPAATQRSSCCHTEELLLPHRGAADNQSVVTQQGGGLEPAQHLLHHLLTFPRRRTAKSRTGHGGASLKPLPIRGPSSSVAYKILNPKTGPSGPNLSLCRCEAENLEG